MSRRKSDGPIGRGARESRVQGEGVRSTCTWKGQHGPYAVREDMLDPEPGRTDTVATELERIAAKARREPKLTFPSLGPHSTLNRLRDHLRHMEKTSAAGVDGQTVAEVTANVDWIAKEALRQIHTQGYHPPPVRRVWIPKAGKAAQRPIGIPTDDCVRCLQDRSEALRVRQLLEERLHQCGLGLAPEKTRLIACGRFAQRDAATPGKPRPETVSFLGFTHYCTRNRQGNVKVERRTERTRLQRATQTIQ